jgi:hypothetical protein
MNGTDTHQLSELVDQRPTQPILQSQEYELIIHFGREGIDLSDIPRIGDKEVFWKVVFVWDGQYNPSYPFDKRGFRSTHQRQIEFRNISREMLIYAIENSE